MSLPDREMRSQPGPNAEVHRELEARIASLEGDLRRLSVARAARDAEIRRLRLELAQRDEELCGQRGTSRRQPLLRALALVRHLASGAGHLASGVLERAASRGRGAGRSGSTALSPESQQALVAGSGFFDSAWYLEQYPDVASAGLDPLRHYLEYGAAEGRDPGPGFDTAFYLRSYPDVARRGVNPLVDHIERGVREGRRTRPASTGTP